MRARVEEHPQLAIAVSAKQKWPAGDRTSAHAVRFSHLAGVTQIQPAVIEDGAAFAFQHLCRRHGRSVDPELAPLGIVDEERDRLVDGLDMRHGRHRTGSSP
jgi:hypothetical protein